MPTIPSGINNQGATAYQQLPEAIRNWLVSDEVYSTFIGLEKKFAIPSDKIRVMPDAIHDIITKEISPDQFVQAVRSGFTLSDQDITIITSTLKEKILNPIAEALKMISGIDISVLPGKNPEKQIPIALDNGLEPLITSAAPKGQPGMALPPTRQTPRPMSDIVAPKQTEKPKEMPVAPKVMEAPKPFMLHEEKPVAANTKPETLRTIKDFSFDAGLAPLSKPTEKPVAAKLDSSFDSVFEQKKATPVTAKTPEEIPKVVHYTSLRTPLAGEKKDDQ